MKRRMLRIAAVLLGLFVTPVDALQDKTADGPAFPQVVKNEPGNSVDIPDALSATPSADSPRLAQFLSFPQSGTRPPSGGFLEGLFGAFSSVPAQYRRQTVRYDSRHPAGTIVIDTGQRYLYHVQGNGTATRYGVGVGRQGFSWKGTAYVGNKRRWPGWTPPAAMRRREPWLPAYMPGGPDNPLGARALYLHKGGKDTLYRIHGTNQPSTIGQALSSGCIRMLNEDVEYLYEQVGIGTKVVVI